jgi:uncharacterized membrane protein
MTDLMGQLLQSGNEALAVDLGLGVVAGCAGFLTVWHAVNRGWGDSRYRVATLVAIAAPVCVFSPNAFFTLGRLIRGVFYGFAMPVVGWLSFMVLVLMAGAALGYMARRSDLRRALEAHTEAAAIPSLGERIKPAIAQTREPALATRQTTAIEVRHVR